MKNLHVILIVLLVFGIVYYNDASELGSGSGSSYPTSIDTDNTPESTDTYAREDVPNDSNAAIIAVQVALGSSPAGAYSDVAARFDAIEESTGTCLPLSGGTMTGAIDMALQNLNNTNHGSFVTIKASNSITGQYNETIDFGTDSLIKFQGGGGAANVDLIFDLDGAFNEPEIYSSQAAIRINDPTRLLGNVSLENAEYISNTTDDYIEFQGVGGDATDIRFDLDGTHPVIDSPNDSKIELAEDVVITRDLEVSGGDIDMGTPIISADGSVLKFKPDGTNTEFEITGSSTIVTPPVYNVDNYWFAADKRLVGGLVFDAVAGAQNSIEMFDSASGGIIYETATGVDYPHIFKQNNVEIMRIQGQDIGITGTPGTTAELTFEGGTGNVKSSGTVTATAYYGDGSALTGITGGSGFTTYYMTLSGGGDVYTATNTFAPISGAIWHVPSTITVTGLSAYVVYTSSVDKCDFNLAYSTCTDDTTIWSYLRTDDISIPVNTKSPTATWTTDVSSTAYTGQMFAVHITSIPGSGNLPAEYGIKIKYWREGSE